MRGPYLFDSYKFAKTEEILSFFEKLGPPDNIIICEADEKHIHTRYKAKNEVEEIGEEQKEQLDNSIKEFYSHKDQFIDAYKNYGERVNIKVLDTNDTLEVT